MAKIRVKCLSVEERSEGNLVTYTSLMYPNFKDDVNDINKKVWINNPNARFEIGGLDKKIFNAGEEYIIKIIPISEDA